MMKALRKGRPTAEFDDESRTITWVMTTGTEDRDGETVDPEGGDFGEFMKNPTVQFNHDTDDFPIGRLAGQPWNDYVGEGTKYDIGGPKRLALLGKVFFSKENPKGDLAYRMAKEGTLGGGSISFLPVDPPRKNANGGNHYGSWKLLEFTICPIGSNPDSVKLSLRAANKVPERLHAGNAEVGEVVVARRAIMSGSEYFAEPGDRLVVVGVDAGQMRVKNDAGEEKLVISNDVRRKSKSPLTLILVGDEVEVIPGSGGHTQYYGGERGTVTEVRPTGYKVQIPGEPYSVAFEKDEVRLTRKKSKTSNGRGMTAAEVAQDLAYGDGGMEPEDFESDSTLRASINAAWDAELYAGVSKEDVLRELRRLKSKSKAQDQTYEVWVIRGSNKIVVYQGDTKPTEEAAHRMADKLGDDYDDVKIVTRPVKLSYKVRGKWLIRGKNTRLGPFTSKSIAQVWADRLNLGKITMKKRRLFVCGKSIKLLKAEGPVDSEMEEYLESRGLEDIQLVDEPPSEEEKYEEIMPEDFLPLEEEEEEQEKVPQEGPSGTQFEVFRDSSGGYRWREIGGSRSAQTALESESIAENNAWRVLGKTARKRTKRMGVEFKPRQIGGQWYCVSLEMDEQTGPYASQQEAQRACDEANAQLTPEQKYEEIEPEDFDPIPPTEDKALQPNPGDDVNTPDGVGHVVSVSGSTVTVRFPDGSRESYQAADVTVKHLKRRKKNADGPAGYRALKAWIKQIEADVADLEQPQVLDAAAKAIKILNGAMGKAYGDLTSNEDDNPDEVKMEDEEEPVEQRQKTQQTITVHNSQESGLRSMARGLGVRIVSERDHGIGVNSGTVFTVDGDPEDIQELAAKFTKSVKSKRLSKKDRALLKELDEYLADPTKCSAAGNKYFAKVLKEMTEDPEEKDVMADDDITEDDEAKIEEGIGQLKNLEARLTEALYRASGKRVWG